MATLRRTCQTVPQPSELRFGVMRAVGRAIAVLDGGSRRASGRGGFGRFSSPFLQWEMPLGRRRWNVSDSYAKNLITFPFGKCIAGKLDLWTFWRYIQFQDQSWGLWEISKNVTIVLRNLRPSQQSYRRNMHIHEWTPQRTALLATASHGAALYPNYFGQAC